MGGGSLREMLGMILQAGCVELGQGEQVYHWLPGVSANFKPAVQPTPEPDILGGHAWLQYFSLKMGKHFKLW